MADDLDGSKFVGLDDNLAGDGSTDSTTKPWDVYLENRVDANNRYLHALGPSVTYNFFTPSNSESVRWYAAYDKMAVFVAPWRLKPSIDSLEVDVLASVGLDTTDSPSVDLEAELVWSGGSASQSGTMTSTAFTAVTLSIDLSSVTPAQRHSWGQLRLWVQSNEETKAGSIQTVDSRSATWMRVTDGSTLDGDLNGKTAVITKRTGSGNGGVQQLVHKSQVASSDHYYGLHGSPSSGGSYSNDIERLEISYFEPLAISVKETRDKESTAGIYSAPDPADMTAQEPTFGRTVSKHSVNLDAIYQSGECRALGPHGQNQGENWPTGANRRWSWTDLTNEDLSVEDNRVIDDQTFQLRHSPADLYCAVYLILTYDLETAFGDSREMTEIDSIGEYSRRGTLHTKMVIQQPSSGDSAWGTVDEVTETQTSRGYPIIPIHPDDLSGTWTDFQRTAYWSRHPRDADDDASQFRYAYTEGLLGSESLQLIPPTPLVIFRVREILPSSSFARDRPFRCRLEYDRSGDGPVSNREGGPDQFGGGRTENTYGICVGTSWWEIPRFS